MELIDGAPAVRLSTMGSHGGTSVTKLGGPSAMDLASGGGDLTTFGGPPAVGFVGGGGGYPMIGTGGLPSATGCTSGASATDAIHDHPTPATTFGDSHLVTITAASPSAPGLAGNPPAVSGGHHAAYSSYPPSLDLLEVLDDKGNKFVLRMNSETSV